MKPPFTGAAAMAKPSLNRLVRDALARATSSMLLSMHCTLPAACLFKLHTAQHEGTRSGLLPGLNGTLPVHWPIVLQFACATLSNLACSSEIQSTVEVQCAVLEQNVADHTVGCSIIVIMSSELFIAVLAQHSVLVFF